MVDELARANSMISIANDQVGQSAIKLDCLGYLSELHELRKVCNLRTNRKVVISKLVRPCLQVLAPGTDEFRNLVILFCEVSHLVTKFGRIAPALNLNLARDRAELINVAWTNFLFNGEQL